MNSFDSIIIGFGKGGKTLAGALAAKGEKVAIIEKSDKMYGGACINVACIPTKSLEHSARLSKVKNDCGVSFDSKASRYKAAVAEKNRLTSMLREKNLQKALASGVTVITGEASFVDSNHISVAMTDGTQVEYHGEKFFINTGGKPFLPPVPGLSQSKFVYTAQGLMNLEELPPRLAVVGGGYIGLEFASYYANFGSEVTVIQSGSSFIPKEDAEVAAAVLENFQARGINVLFTTEIMSIEDKTSFAALNLKTADRHIVLEAEAVLVATGRRPEISGLNLEAAGVQLTESGSVKTDQTLQTTAPNIWAMGDVKGGMQFTYISLDDFRIVSSQLLGDGLRTTENRGAVPYSVFIDPPLSRVGMTEKEAIDGGYNLKTAVMSAAAIPKAQVLRSPEGMLKVIVDGDTDLILGAHLFCAESCEIINIIKLAIDCKIPYTSLKNGIFTHPTMSEGLNDLFGLIK